MARTTGRPRTEMAKIIFDASLVQLLNTFDLSRWTGIHPSTQLELLSQAIESRWQSGVHLSVSQGKMLTQNLNSFCVVISLSGLMLIRPAIQSCIQRGLDLMSLPAIMSFGMKSCPDRPARTCSTTPLATFEGGSGVIPTSASLSSNGLIIPVRCHHG